MTKVPSATTSMHKSINFIRSNETNRTVYFYTISIFELHFAYALRKIDSVFISLASRIASVTEDRTNERTNHCDSLGAAYLVSSVHNIEIN